MRSLRAQANLARYIADESQHKREMALDAAEWPRSAPTNIPEQKNGCDCGVFMVKYADWLVRARSATPPALSQSASMVLG